MEHGTPSCPLLSLSTELQLHIIGYLTFATTLQYVSCNRALSRLIPLTLQSDSYAPWRRRRHCYIRCFNKLMEDFRAAERDHIRALSLTYTIDAHAKFELETSTLMRDMGLIVDEARENARNEARNYIVGRRQTLLSPERIPDLYMAPLRYGDTFIALQHFFTSPKATARLPVLHIPTRTFVSLLESKFPPSSLIQTLVAFSIVPDESTHYLDTRTLYQLLTAYLYFTELVPDDIPWLLHNAVIRSDKAIQHDSSLDEIQAATLEYFCFLSVFFFAIEKDEILTGCVIPELPNDYGPPLTQQSARILHNRLNRWIERYFASPRPLMMSRGGRTVLTSEQQLVVNTDMGPGDLLKVKAYAGTGKTKCLVHYAAARPKKRFLYIAFNKSIARDSVEKFPPNVDSKTMHALAWNALPEFAAHIKAKPGPLLSEEIIEFLEIDQAYMNQNCHPIYHTASIDQFLRTPAKPKPSSLGTLIRDTLDRFYRSPSPKVETRHVSPRAQNLGIGRDTVARLAEQVWEEQNSANSRMRSIPHDAYLKMLYLKGRPNNDEKEMEDADKIKKWIDADKNIFQGYDGILFDEAQDATPVFADILLRQRPYLGIMLVGDPYQMIYQFMGADNCCFNDEIYPPTKTFYLTHSFRFGENIAGVANVILRAFNEKVLVSGAYKKDKVMRDFGVPGQHSIEWKPTDKLAVRPPGDPSHGGSAPFAVIFRKNKTMINSLIDFTLNCQQHKVFLKSSHNYTPSAIFKLLRDAHALHHRNKRSNHPALKPFESWNSLMHHIQVDVQGTEDLVLDNHLSLIYSMKDRIMRHPPSSFENVIRDCEKSLVSREEDADVIFTTCHQAKGLEWDRVHLADDFLIPFSARKSLQSSSVLFSRAEMNMVYVAATRARKELIVCSQLVDYMVSEYGLFRSFLARSPTRIPVQLQVLNHIDQVGPIDIIYSEKTDGIPHCTHDMSQLFIKHPSSPPVFTKVMWETTIPYGSFIFKQTSPSRYHSPVFATRKPLFCYDCAANRLHNGKAAVRPPQEYNTRFLQALGPRATTEDYKRLLAEESVPFARSYAARHILGQFGSPLERSEHSRVNAWCNAGRWNENAGLLLQQLEMDFYIPEGDEKGDEDEEYGINEGDEELWRQVERLMEMAEEFSQVQYLEGDAVESSDFVEEGAVSSSPKDDVLDNDSDMEEKEYGGRTLPVEGMESILEVDSEVESEIPETEPSSLATPSTIFTQAQYSVTLPIRSSPPPRPGSSSPPPVSSVSSDEFASDFDDSLWNLAVTQAEALGY